MSVASPNVDAPPAAKWPEDWDEVVVRLLVSGLSDLAERCAEGDPIRLPYPASLQRALDRLVARCLVEKQEPPQSMVDLIRWCSRPVGQWPLRLNVDGLDPGIRFLAGGYPSRECDEWDVSAADVEGEFRQNKLIYEVLDICRGSAREDVYVAFRKLLIDKPAMTEQERALELGRPEFVLVSHQVQRAYQPAPPEALIGGVALVCRGCGNLLLPAEDGKRACVEPDCTEPAETATVVPADAGVLWVGREIRVWVCAPGRPELRMWRRLEDKGLNVDLWPGFDAADLRIRFSPTDVWYADVKTWSSPAGLARRLRRKPFLPPDDASGAFIVIGREQTAGRRGYLNELVNRTPALSGSSRKLTAIGERDFISAALRHQEAAGA
jgi:hypothetical protein